MYLNIFHWMIMSVGLIIRFTSSITLIEFKYFTLIYTNTIFLKYILMFV